MKDRRCGQESENERGGVCFPPRPACAVAFSRDRVHRARQNRDHRHEKRLKRVDHEPMLGDPGPLGARAFDDLLEQCG